MVSLRLRAAASTSLLVVGAVLVGDALHGAVMTDAYPATSPPAVLRVVAGAALIAVGSRLSDARAEYARSVAGDDGPRTAGPDGTDGTGPGAAGRRADSRAEYDPDLSPFPDGDAGDEEGSERGSAAGRDAVDPADDTDDATGDRRG